MLHLSAMTQSLPKALLFDLDGTLADTAPDLAYALNQTLQHYGEPALPYQTIRPVVSHGGLALIQLGFHLNPGDDGFDERRQYLLDVYRQNLCRETRLFDGMAQVLQHLKAAGILWGIVTNKPAWLTDPLTQKLDIDQQTNAIISGDTCAHRKPHPEPIRYACRLLQVEPTETWYIGDAERDIQAGRSAGCDKLIGAGFGYIHPTDAIETWHADYIINHPCELIPLITGEIPQSVRTILSNPLYQ